MAKGYVTSFIHYYVTILILIAAAVSQAKEDGSCRFDDNMCGYTTSRKPTSDSNFRWAITDHSYLSVTSRGYDEGHVATVESPLMSLKQGHCVTFKYRFTVTSSALVTSSPVVAPSSGGGEMTFGLSVLNVGDEASFQQKVWMTSSIDHNDVINDVKGEWKEMTVSLSPSTYQLIFEAEVITASDQNLIAVEFDEVSLLSSVCQNGNTHRFLRMSDHDVNEGQFVIFQCGLYQGGSTDDDVDVDDVTFQQAGSMTSLQPDYVTTSNDHVFYNFRLQGTNDGTYRCVYVNDDVIAVSNPAHLVVKYLPQPVVPPKALKVESTHIKVDLNTATYHGDGPIVRKILTYHQVDGGWNQTHEVDDSDDVYELWHLTPDTDYQMYVTMERGGQGGRGKDGPYVTIRTKCSVPSIRPHSVTLTSPSYDVIVLQWEKLEFTEINCHTYRYRVRYRVIPDNIDDISTVTSPYLSIYNGKKSIARVKSLEPYTNYELKVAISNEAGTLETSSYYKRTLESVPGPIPTESFVVTSKSETTIDLKWEKPQRENGLLQNYEISYQATSSYDPTFNVENENAHIEQSFPDRTITLKQLRPGTQFLISICAETSVGCGPQTSLNVTTDIAPPTMPSEPPIAVNESHVTDTTVEVTLVPAASNGAPVTQYYVVVEDITEDQQEAEENGSRRKRRSVGGMTTAAVVDEHNSNDEATTPSSTTPSSGKRDCGPTEALDYETAKKKNSTTFVVAQFTPEELNKERTFVVGDGSESNGFKNVGFKPNRKYRIYLKAVSEVNGQKKSSCMLLYQKDKVPETMRGDSITEEESEVNDVLLYGSIGGAVAALIIFLIIFIIVYRVQRKRKTPQKDEVVNPFEVRLMLTDITNNVSPNNSHLLPAQSNQPNSYMSDVVTYHDHTDFSDQKGGEVATSSTAPAATNEAHQDEKFAIRVDDFHLHVSQMKSVDGYGFREEFSLFPDGPTAPWTIAQASINKKKNRYGNMMAYDHSRVILQPLHHSTINSTDSTLTSDYINASYISGYKRPSMYIATQAPSSETCSHFWLMIWQERCSVIVMLTNLMELGKRKCHKYWNDERTSYGSLEVSMTNEEFTSDYVVRTFLLREVSGYDVREVRQFHFSSWPDHGVPSRPTNLLTFVRRVKAYEPPEGPTIVHCSAGSGRTGCYITIDQMLDMAREEEIVDVFNTVRDLRTRRVDMVQTEEQYIFIHEAILEALICGETSVQPDQLAQHYDEIITVDVVSNLAPIQDEFDTLNLITPRLGDDECSIARLPRNRGYNRFKDVLPADRHLAYLLTPDSSDRNNSYINAVFVDSYSRKNAFLVTQIPLPNTIVDLWRLIYDHQCNSIVMMNHESEHDQTCAIYWPTNDQIQVSYGPFTIELLSEDDEIDVITRTFKLHNNNQSNEGATRLVKQFQLSNWPAPQPVPNSRNALLRMIELNMKWNNECERMGTQQRGRTVVHCVAGAGRSGTYVACHNMCEQMDAEYSADVFNNVQRLRNIRPHLVETLEQYRFCYEVAIEFTDQ